MNRTSRPRGMTLIEIIVANAILAGMMIMVMIMIASTGRVTSDATQRSFITSQGNATLSLMVRELESGYFSMQRTTTLFSLGDAYDTSTQAFTINDASVGSNPSALRDESGGSHNYYGRAIRFQPVTGFDANDYLNDTNESGPVVGSEIVFAFVADETVNSVDDDGDGLIDEMKLVRGEGTLVVDLLTDIPRGEIDYGSTTPSPNPHLVPEHTPYFELNPDLNAIAELQIVFDVRRRVDYEGERTDRPGTLENDKYLFARERFTKRINLRNLNQ